MIQVIRFLFLFFPASVSASTSTQVSLQEIDHHFEVMAENSKRERIYSLVGGGIRFGLYTGGFIISEEVAPKILYASLASLNLGFGLWSSLMGSEAERRLHWYQNLPQKDKRTEALSYLKKASKKRKRV